MIKKYKLEWFDNGFWSWDSAYVLAENYEQALEWINNYCPKEQRLRETFESEGKVDSLSITVSEYYLKFPLRVW